MRKTYVFKIRRNPGRNVGRTVKKENGDIDEKRKT